MHSSAVEQRLSSTKSSAWICMQSMIRCTINRRALDINVRDETVCLYPKHLWKAHVQGCRGLCFIAINGAVKVRGKPATMIIVTFSFVPNRI